MDTSREGLWITKFQIQRYVSIVERTLKKFSHETLSLSALIDSCEKRVRGLTTVSTLSYLQAHCTNDPNMCIEQVVCLLAFIRPAGPLCYCSPLLSEEGKPKVDRSPERLSNVYWNGLWKPISLMSLRVWFHLDVYLVLSLESTQVNYVNESQQSLSIISVLKSENQRHISHPKPLGDTIIKPSSFFMNINPLVSCISYAIDPVAYPKFGSLVIN